MNPASAKPATNLASATGWQAHLELGFAHINARTRLRHSRHIGPLRVQRAFYPEGNLAHIYILHPPGGVVGGDQLHITLDIAHKAQVLCTTPGSGKFYLSAGEWAVLEQTLRIKSGASLEWFPQENILFAGARLRARTRIELEDDAVFMGWDITCLGRPGSQERFEHGAFDARLEFYHNQKLLLVENQRVLDKQVLEAAAGLRGQPMQATLLAFPCDENHLEQVRNQLIKNGASTLTGVTLIDGLLVVRALGDNSETLKQQLITIWQTLRPGLLDRPAVLPRIWAT
ncbi:Urease accessory protein UreD [hydrothermal vent metagenome]|uniref:Urease accessory protein UreD n=1 Tax=hydrothermal vent metagenome TaxID=652676 RepID=A0A3B1AVN0_9ZZZZ